MARLITKDTLLCMSLAARPSNIGTRFHNHLYEELGLDYIYKAFTTTDLPAAIGGIRALGIRGCGISMPYKEACIEYLDGLDDSARAILLLAAGDGREPPAAADQRHARGDGRRPSGG